MLPQPKLIAEAIITVMLVIPLCNAEFSQYIQKTYSPTPMVLYHHSKTKLNFFLQSDHINWCMQHHSLEEGEPLHSGEI